MVGPQQRLDFSFSEHPGKKPCSLPLNSRYLPCLLKPYTEQRSGFLKPDAVANKSGVKPALRIAFLAIIGFLKKQNQSHTFRSKLLITNTNNEKIAIQLHKYTTNKSTTVNMAVKYIPIIHTLLHLNIWWSAHPCLDQHLNICMYESSSSEYWVA